MRLFRTAYRRFHDLKLLRKLWLSFFFVSFLTLSTFALLSSTYIKQMITTREGDAMVRNIGYFTGSLNNYFQSIEKSALVLSYSPSIQELFTRGNVDSLDGDKRIQAYNDINNQMHQMWDNVYGIEAIFLIDRYKNVFDLNLGAQVHSPYLTSDDFINQGWYDHAQQSSSSSYWSIIEWSEGNRSIVLFKAIYNRTDLNLIGNLVVSLSPDVFDSYLSASNLEDGDNSIVDASGFVYSAAKGRQQQAQAIDMSRLQQDKGYVTQKLDSGRYMIAYSHNPLTNWTYVHSVKVSVVLKDLQRITSLWYWFLFVSLLLMMVVSALISKTISLPLQKMVKLLREVERGNLNARFNSLYRDELGMMGHAFNNMLEKVSEGIPLIREKFIRSLLERNMSAEELVEYERKLGFRFEQPVFQVVLIDMQNDIDERQLGSAELLVHECEARWPLIAVHLSNNQFCLIFNCPEAETVACAEELLRTMRMRYGARTFAFVGNAYDDVNFIKTSFEEAKGLLKYGLAERADQSGSEAGIYFASDSWQTQYPEFYENRLVYYMEEGDLANCTLVMEELVAYARSNHIAPPIMNTFFAAMYNQLNKLSIKLGSQVDLIDSDRLNALNAQLSLESLEKNCADFLALLQEHLQSDNRERKKISANVAKSLQIIHDEYHNSELSVDFIARQLSLNTNYFSQLFKKEVGVGFADYVSNLRMEQAKKLLGETGLKIKDVAGRTGFADPHYFGVWFKDNTGLSPSQFRKQLWNTASGA